MSRLQTIRNSPNLPLRKTDLIDRLVETSDAYFNSSPLLDSNATSKLLIPSKIFVVGPVNT